MPKDPLTAILGIATAWIVFVVVKGFGHFVLVEAEWEVVWANRVLVLIGQQMTEFMTQSPGSEFCIDECYATNQNWRFWPILYLVFIMVGAAYGTTGDNWVKFCIGFALASGFLVAVAIVKTFMIGVASAIVDVQGRRVLLLYSSGGIVASLGLLAFSLSTTPPIIGLSYTASAAAF